MLENKTFISRVKLKYYFLKLSFTSNKYELFVYHYVLYTVLSYIKKEIKNLQIKLIFGKKYHYEVLDDIVLMKKYS